MSIWDKRSSAGSPEIQHPPSFRLVEDKPRSDIPPVGGQGAVVFRGRYPGIPLFLFGMYHDIPDDLHLSVLIHELYHQWDDIPLAAAPAFARDFFLYPPDDSRIPIIGICPYPKCPKLPS